MPASTRTYRLFWFAGIWLAILLAGPRLLAQTPGASVQKQVDIHVQEGHFYRQQELYYEAAQLYEKARRLDPDNLEATYWLAECHRYSFHYELAEKGYGSVHHAQSADYPLALFYFALMQKLNGKYDEALQHFTEFIRQAGHKPRSDLTGTVQRAQHEKAGCELALKQKTLLQNNYHFRLLPSPVSSPFNDYAPILSGRDSLLLVSSSRPGSRGKLQDAKLGEALSDFYGYEASDTDQVWHAYRSLQPVEVVNTKWSEGSGCFNRKLDKFYFTSCRQSNSHCEIFVTQFHQGKWQEPVKLNRNINQPGYDSRHPMLSAGGDTLFLVSNRPGGQGLNDLWMSVTSGADQWGPPVNLGSTINTPMNEISPFFDATEKVLFFASDGHKGLGGLDLFMARKIPQNTWELTNMGPPFNSNMDDAFLTEGRQLGYMASNRRGGIGQFDVYGFQLISQESPVIALDRSPQPDLPDLAYLRDFRFDYLSAKDKLRVDEMLAQKTAGQVYQTTLPLSREDQQFYLQLSAAEKVRMTQAATTLFSQMSAEKLNQLRASDALYYQLLPRQEQLRINRLVRAHQQALMEQTPLNLSEQDAAYYDALSSPERKLLHRIIASRMDAPDHETEAEFVYETLPVIEKERINRIAAARRAAQQNNQEIQLSEEDARYYNELPPDQKAAVDRLIAAKLAGEEPAFDYQQLPTEEKKRIDRIVAARRAARQLGQEAQLSEEDAHYYAQMTQEEKATVDRLVEERIAAIESSRGNAANETPFDYQSLPLEDQRRINRIAAARRAAQQNNQEIQLSEEDARYYNELPPDQKAAVDRLIAAKLTGEEPAFDYQQLPTEEKKRIDRIVAARRAARQLGQEAQLSEEDAHYYAQMTQEEKNQIDLMATVSPRLAASTTKAPRPLTPKALPPPESTGSHGPFHTGDYESITIGGQLLDARTEQPAAGVEVRLVNSSGLLLKSTTTNEMGRFQYVQLEPDADYQIRINTPPKRITNAQLYRIQDLEMIGYDRKVADVSYEPVFFDFNQYALRPEARKVLGELVTLSMANPDMQAEIHAFTDAIGSDAYNLELSRKRAQAVYDYLIAQGIRASALAKRYSGKAGATYSNEDPAGRQANRRVEITLKGAPGGYRPLTYTYILQTPSTVGAIAETFGMTLEELRELNDFPSDTVSAYRPVRVRDRRKTPLPASLPASGPLVLPAFQPSLNK